MTLVHDRTDIFAKESIEKAGKSCFVFNVNAKQFDKTVTLETQKIMKLTDRRCLLAAEFERFTNKVKTLNFVCGNRIYYTNATE